MNVQHVNGDQASMAASTTHYFLLFESQGAPATTAESRVGSRIESPGVLSNLGCYISSNSRAQSNVRSRINTVNGNCNCVVSASTTGQFEDTSNTDSLDNDEDVNVSVTTGSGGSAFVIQSISSIFAPTSGTVKYFGLYGAGVTANADTFVSFVGSSPGAFVSTVTTETHEQMRAGTAMTLQELYVNVDANSRTGTTIVRSRVNSANGNLACQYLTTATGEVEDLSNTDSVSDGDEVNYMVDVGDSGTASFRYRHVKIETSATDAFPFLTAQDPSLSATTQNSGLTRYLFPGGLLTGEIDATEANKQIKANVAFTWSDLCGFVSAYSLNTGDYVIRSRVNGNNGNQVITFAGTGQQVDTSNTDSVADDDEFNYSSVTGGASGSVTLRNVSSLASSAGGAGGTAVKDLIYTGLIPHAR